MAMLSWVLFWDLRLRTADGPNNIHSQGPAGIPPIRLSATFWWTPLQAPRPRDTTAQFTCVRLGIAPSAAAEATPTPAPVSFSFNRKGSSYFQSRISRSSVHRVAANIRSTALLQRRRRPSVKPSLLREHPLSLHILHLGKFLSIF